MQERMTNFATGLREAWSLAKPYFHSEERWAARGLLGLVIALNLVVVGMNVVITYWNNDFYNAIQVYNEPLCWRLLYYPLIHIKNSPLPIIGFAELIAAYVLIATYATYFAQMLQIKWRQWLTTHYVESWLHDRAYYKISLSPQHGQTVDNPDQRISEDLRDFASITLALGIDFVTNVVTLFSFVFVLYSLSGLIHVFGFTIHGYLVWVALLYSLAGTVITQLIGRKLISLSFLQQRLEANFRYRLVRVRDNPEAIALSRGEGEEHAGLNTSFREVRNNFWAIMGRTVPLNFFTTGFAQIANIFPLVVILPRYFAKQIGFGALAQIPIAFSQVQGALSWFVANYFAGNTPSSPGLVTWRATVSRLYGFKEAMAAAQAASLAGPEHEQSGGALTLRNLTLTLPDGRQLLNDANLTLTPGKTIIVTGASGTGKSTLFRALAGIWPFGNGGVRLPSGSVLFLPQRPYFPLGSLRHSLAYPADEAILADTEARATLAAVGLEYLIPRLDEVENWGQILSGGEQQRLAITRALLAKPDWLFLDEATSALDGPMDRHIQAVLKEQLPGTTVVAITHREGASPSQRRIKLSGGVLAEEGPELERDDV